MNISTQHEIVSIVNDQIRETVQFFEREGWVPEGYIPSVRIDFLLYRSRSRGGRSSYDRSFVSLETARFLNEDHDFFTEYKRFAEDPEIGSVSEDRPRAIRTMVVHELCHALQFGPHGKSAAKKIGFKNPSANDMKGHKIVWQTLYRLTRRALLNPPDTEQINPHIVEEAPEPSYDSPLPPLKRKEAIVVIQGMLADAKTNKEVINFLVTQHGMKPSTAAVYTSQAGPNAGTRPRKKCYSVALVPASLCEEWGIGIAAATE